MPRARPAPLGLLSHTSNSPFKSSLKNGPDATKRLAGMGSHRVNARPTEGGQNMRHASIAPRGTNFVGPTNFAPIDEQEAARSFASAVIDFDAATLARAARRHPETAKLWKAGKRCPNSSSVINMASLIPAVQGWLDGEIESRTPRPPADSRTATAAYARLQQEAMQPGERGAMARAILSDLNGPR